MFKFLLHKKNITTMSKIQGTVSYLNQADMAQLDADLLNKCKFSIDQLMELAGLSCATAIYKTYPPTEIDAKAVLVCCGPGNNGGDGLVLARHLKLFQYKNVQIHNTKHNPKFDHLVDQCKTFNIPFVDQANAVGMAGLGLIVDAVFGFSFKPPVRQDYVPLMDFFKSTNIPIASVDIPSGWNVDEGPNQNDFTPDLLISLTVPKLCATGFKGTHYVGGRFIPDSLVEKYQLKLPKYPSTECVFKL